LRRETGENRRDKRDVVALRRDTRHYECDEKTHPETRGWNATHGATARTDATSRTRAARHVRARQRLNEGFDAKRTHGCQRSCARKNRSTCRGLYCFFDVEFC
jgi:hypothetical protein